MSSKINVGEVFGRLTVVERVGSTKKFDGTVGERILRCSCSCGSVKDVRAYSLRSGNTKSCGCIRRERIINLNVTRGGDSGKNK